jgi:hypothetical protein
MGRVRPIPAFRRSGPSAHPRGLACLEGFARGTLSSSPMGSDDAEAAGDCEGFSILYSIPYLDGKSAGPDQDIGVGYCLCIPERISSVFSYRVYEYGSCDSYDAFGVFER